MLTPSITGASATSVTVDAIVMFYGMKIMNTERLKRRLARLQKQRDELKSKHEGHEQEYTYYAGYSLGHIEGRIYALEDLLDEILET